MLFACLLVVHRDLDFIGLIDSDLEVLHPPVGLGRMRPGTLSPFDSERDKGFDLLRGGTRAER